MSDGTKIQWTDATWNPIRAGRRDGAPGPAMGWRDKGWHCERVSPGCQNCYAERLNEKRFGTGLPYNRKSRDLVEVYLDEKALTQPLHWRRPRKIFVCSMTDLFGEWVPDEMIDRVFAVMALTPQHTFQLLTKRPERMREYVSSARSRVAALLYNATYEQRADDPLANALRTANRRHWENLEGGSPWRTPGSGSVRGEALRASANGVSAEAGLPLGGSNDRRSEVRHGSPSAGLDTPAWANPERAHREPQERDQGRQSPGEPGASDGVGESIPRLASSQRISPSSDWDGQPQDPSLRGRRSGDEAIALRWSHGQGDSKALRHESQGRVQNLQQGDLDSHLNWPLSNCWLGVSVENQERADQRIPWLLATPAAVRFISAEPLLGPLQLEEYLHDSDCWARFRDPPAGLCICNEPREEHISWVIVGGESGPGARPCDVAWIRGIVRQCQAAHVAVFVKQLGRRVMGRPEREPYLSRWILSDGSEWVPPVIGNHAVPENAIGWISAGKGGELAGIPEDLRVREFPEVGR